MDVCLLEMVFQGFIFLWEQYVSDSSTKCEYQKTKTVAEIGLDLQANRWLVLLYNRALNTTQSDMFEPLLWKISLHGALHISLCLKGSNLKMAAL